MRLPSMRNAWLESVLCPRLDTSHVVILDNASFHKSQQTEALMAGCGASLLFTSVFALNLILLKEILRT